MKIGNFVKTGTLFILVILLFCLLPYESKAIETVPWEEYRPRLETEFIYPFFYYDEEDFYAALYGQMSDILREQELMFVLYANGKKEDFQYALGYTRHYAKWSCGINLYSMPVYLGTLWDPGVYEYQKGLSILGSYHWNNETRLDLRLQYENFEAEARSSELEELVENGKVLGWEMTVNHDNYEFLSQSGTRQYISLGGASPLFETDYDYFKLEGDHRSYHPLGGRLSLIWGARAGKMWGDYPAHRGFLIGGIQTANISSLGGLTNLGTLGGLADSVLRGYSNNSFVGDGFITSNLELRGLIWPAAYQQIGNFALLGALFVDVGQVWDEGTLLTSEPPASWGAGLKFLILRGLMLGIDYAVPFDSEEEEKWHFSLGEVF